MALLICVALVESACVAELYCDDQWLLATTILLVMLVQFYAAALHFERTQSVKRFNYALDMLVNGSTPDEARMAAHFHHPGLRIFGRLAKDQLWSIVSREG